ncbi:MAG: hypothetical protein ACLTDV_09090 [Eubacterium sp.]
MLTARGYYTQIFDDDSEQLSGGERNIKQLRALCESDAEILFLDEPSSHLDTYAQIALEKAIKEYQGTVLMVTHDFYAVANCADRIYYLRMARSVNRAAELTARVFIKNILRAIFLRQSASVWKRKCGSMHCSEMVSGKKRRTYCRASDKNFEETYKFRINNVEEMHTL